jgi:hypothetical protein
VDAASVPVVAAGADLGAGSGRPQPTAPAPYLEIEVTTWEQGVEKEEVEKEEVEKEKLTGLVKLKKCGCGSVWCGEGCGMQQGLRVRDRLRDELANFRCPYQVVVTVDRALFPDGPESAYRWVQETHALSEFVKRLRRGGWLYNGKYFRALEFQMKHCREGWPHWHIVVDSFYIPFFEIADAWAAAGWGGKLGVARWGPRPKTIIGGSRPVFGGVRFTDKGSVRRIVRYLTSYLVKQPKEGLPEWLMDTRLQMRRWSVSRGFWSPSSSAPLSFSDLREKYVEDGESWGDGDGVLLPVERVERSRCTLRHRLASCGEKTAVLVQTLIKVEADGFGLVRWRFAGLIPAPVWKTPLETGCTGSRLWEYPIGGGKEFLVSREKDLAFLSSLLSADVEGRRLSVAMGVEYGNHWKN